MSLEKDAELASILLREAESLHANTCAAAAVLASSVQQEWLKDAEPDGQEKEGVVADAPKTGLGPWRVKITRGEGDGVRVGEVAHVQALAAALARAEKAEGAVGALKAAEAVAAQAKASTERAMEEAALQAATARAAERVASDRVAMLQEKVRVLNRREQKSHTVCTPTPCTLH